MALVYKVVQQVLTAGYLTVETEDHLSRLLIHRCDVTDIDALISLQEAVVAGRVKRLATYSNGDTKSELALSTSRR